MMKAAGLGDAAGQNDTRQCVDVEFRDAIRSERDDVIVDGAGVPV